MFSLRLPMCFVYICSWRIICCIVIFLKYFLLNVFCVRIEADSVTHMCINYFHYKIVRLHGIMKDRWNLVLYRPKFRSQLNDCGQITQSHSHQHHQTNMTLQSCRATVFFHLILICKLANMIYSRRSSYVPTRT